MQIVEQKKSGVEVDFVNIEASRAPVALALQQCRDTKREISRRAMKGGKDLSNINIFVANVHLL